jgi:hypothetical protein
METIMKIFGSMIVFVYHCFDRIAINGYISSNRSQGSGVRDQESKEFLHYLSIGGQRGL